MAAGSRPSSGCDRVPRRPGPPTGPPRRATSSATRSRLLPAQFLAALISASPIGEDDGVDEDEMRATFLLGCRPSSSSHRDLRRARRRCSARTSSSRCACTSAACRCSRCRGLTGAIVDRRARHQARPRRLRHRGRDRHQRAEAPSRRTTVPEARQVGPRLGATALGGGVPGASLERVRDRARHRGRVQRAGHGRRDRGPHRTSPTLTEGQGCEWETSTNGGVDSNTLGVDVYASPEPYEGYVDRHELSERPPASAMRP